MRITAFGILLAGIYPNPLTNAVNLTMIIIFYKIPISIIINIKFSFDKLNLGFLSFSFVLFHFHIQHIIHTYKLEGYMVHKTVTTFPSRSSLVNWPRASAWDSIAITIDITENK